MDEKTILELLWNRAESAIAALQKSFGKGLYRLAMNILGSHPDAEETVSDTYFALWNSIPPQHPEPLAPYVYRTGRNLSLKRLRSNTAVKRDDRYDLCLEELSESLSGGSMDDAMDAKELGLAIDRFLNTQAKENRVLFVRRYWFGDSVSELAKRFGMTAGSVSTRLSRVRSSLKEYLMKEEIYL